MTPTDALAQRYGGIGPSAASSLPLIDAMLAHRSVRGYRPDGVAAGDLALALAAAQSAATSSNLQLWSVVTVADPARKGRLNALAGNQRHIDEAPLLLIWLADLSRLRRLNAEAGRPAEALDYLELFLTAIIDASLAAQNAATAFEAMGYGTCYIGAMRNHPVEVAQELKLPRECFAVFGLTVGRPAPGKEGNIKPRLPQATVSHTETYDGSTLEAGVTGYDAAMLAFNAAEGLAPVRWRDRCAERVAGPKAMSNRENLRSYLETLGFALR
jgi:nitroreductase